jgi:CHASE3 domain sensor protein
MGLPRKKVREKRQELKIQKLEAKAAAKIERIEKGETLGARIGDALGDLAGSAASSAGRAIDSSLNGAPVTADPPAPAIALAGGSNTILVVAIGAAAIGAAYFFAKSQRWL